MKGETQMATNTERINGLEKDLRGVKSDISNMNDSLAQILTLLTSTQTSTSTKHTVVEEVKEDSKLEPHIDEIPKEPELSQSIRIKSLFVGNLTLGYGDNKSINFTYYGQEYPVLYRDLISIINMNRRFSDTGYFYITNPSAIYHLGLAETYKHILDFNTIEGVSTMNANDVESLICDVTDYQKSLVAERLAMKVANGEKVDRNVIAIVDRITKSNIEDTAYKIENVLNRK